MKGKLYCCCAKADKNCHLLCSRGRRLNPDHIVMIKQWPKVESWEYPEVKEQK